MYDDIAEETGMDKKTLWEYKNVSQSIKPSARAEQLSYTHHREVASLPPSGSIRSTRTEAMRSINIRRYQMRTFELCPSQRRRAQGCWPDNNTAVVSGHNLICLLLHRGRATSVSKIIKKPVARLSLNVFTCDNSKS